MSASLLDRRGFLGSAASIGAVFLGAPAIAQMAGATPDAGQVQYEAPKTANISSWRARHWSEFFPDRRNGCIACDLTSRTLHFWSEDGEIYRILPSSIPASTELTRTGRTEIIKKVEGPTWSPTPSMREKNPEWPAFVPAGPDNPLGTHALWLSWQYYRIHGTHDTRKIGRKSSNGCIGLYNEHIKILYGLTKVGTQVVVFA
ncbi:L,D-transpeptidase [Paracoccus litorisediminis]|uniref:L,D-transpeptidase n=1 Tax=Paracoccus litorisediminis TaxID=2006130 RepID=UPI003732E967